MRTSTCLSTRFFSLDSFHFSICFIQFSFLYFTTYYASRHILSPSINASVSTPLIFVFQGVDASLGNLVIVYFFILCCCYSLWYLTTVHNNFLIWYHSSEVSIIATFVFPLSNFVFFEQPAIHPTKEALQTTIFSPT